MSNQTITIPYGHKKLELQPDFISWELLESAAHGTGTECTQEEIVSRAMEQPIGTARLEELVKGKKRVTIILSDHTRPVPSKVIIPPMLRAIRMTEPDIEITFLVATGCHRGTTTEELRGKLGDEIVEKERIIIHDCDAADDMIELGTLPSGIPFRVNRVAVETDLLLAEGFIEPHFFAGFSGGRKSVLPGVCSRETVMANHCARFIDSPLAIAGNLKDNPIHRDMLAAARMVNLAYIVNVILDQDKKVIYAVAGDVEEAHLAGCQEISKVCGVHPQQKGDVVITSNGGAPLDQNIYQVVKSMSTAEAAAAKGATIIVCAECADGSGGKAFYESMKNCQSPAQLLQEIRKVAPLDTVPDQWQYQILCRILEKHRVIFVTRPEMKDMILEMKMEYSESLEEAVADAMKDDPGKHVLVLPDGIATMVI